MSRVGNEVGDCRGEGGHEGLRTDKISDDVGVAKVKNYRVYPWFTCTTSTPLIPLSHAY
jgi:hypothetical protein